MIIEINDGELRHVENTALDLENVENTALDLESIALAAEQAPEGVEVEITKTPHTLLVRSTMGTKLFVELKSGPMSIDDSAAE